MTALFRGLFRLFTLISASGKAASGCLDNGTGCGIDPFLSSPAFHCPEPISSSFPDSLASLSHFSLSLPALVFPFSPPIDSGHSEGAGVRP